MIREIRYMTPEDTGKVSALLAECFTHPWSEDSVKAMFSEKGYVSLIACSQDEIVGYIGMKCVFDEADITNVAVLPSFRRHGIGDMLLNKLLLCAKEKQLQHIFLEVRMTNRPAVCLYEKAGFCEIGQRKNYYTEPKEDALIMQWVNHE